MTGMHDMKIRSDWSESKTTSGFQEKENKIQ